jgi:hypothetical protein
MTVAAGSAWHKRLIPQGFLKTGLEIGGHVRVRLQVIGRVVTGKGLFRAGSLPSSHGLLLPVFRDGDRALDGHATPAAGIGHHDPAARMLRAYLGVAAFVKLRETLQSRLHAYVRVFRTIFPSGRVTASGKSGICRNFLNWLSEASPILPTRFT